METQHTNSRWERTERPSDATSEGVGPRARGRGGAPGRPDGQCGCDGYWQEWIPDTPEANMGYVAHLYLPAGRFILNASATIRIDGSATSDSEVECSLFVDGNNVGLNQLTLSPGQGTSLAATSHVDSATPSYASWECGSTVAPFRLGLALTAVQVDQLHHISSPESFET